MRKNFKYALIAFIFVLFVLVLFWYLKRTEKISGCKKIVNKSETPENLEKEFKRFFKECNQKYPKNKRQEIASCVLAKLNCRQYQLKSGDLYPFVELMLKADKMPYVSVLYYKTMYVKKNNDFDSFFKTEDKVYILKQLALFDIKLGKLDEAKKLINTGLDLIKETEKKNSDKEDNDFSIDFFGDEKKEFQAILSVLENRSFDRLPEMSEQLKEVLSFFGKNRKLSIEFLTKNMDSFFIEDDYRLTKINYLLQMGEETPVLDLLKQKKDIPRSDSFPLLLSAIMGHSNKTAQFLLNNDKWVKTDFLGLNWVDYAIVFDNEDIIFENRDRLKPFLKQRDKFGDTPLFYAVRLKKTELAKFLLEVGGDFSRKNNCGYNVVDEAIMAGEYEVLSFLTEKKGIVLNSARVNELYPYFSTSKNLCKILDFYFSKGVEISGLNLAKSLYFAVKNDKKPIVECLLKFPVDLGTKPYNNETVFFRVKSEEVAEMLLKKLKNPEVLLEESRRNFLAVDAVKNRVRQLYKNYLFNHNLYPGLKGIRRKYAK